ncbi:stage III sporulation protein AF [Cohnella zeiphila]|uniref:Stage III sporulation protein AF n=1 Tax=Cohnella zeiphila TaxID=2761120 RepID=A0A7X0SIC2_9BACL|nr:stage III sporulation protein AF [Cohnella zeiphila]MBB6730528.1 stage III sporulation protein AF [Cohnella zeiphila]
MASLSGWLQQIVAVVLLASLVDLLLPNRTMQRYVRLVAGLLVLMTVSTPLLHWFKQDFGSELSRELGSIRLSPTTDPAELGKIRDDASKLSASRDRQAAQLASSELAAQIETAVDRSGVGEVRKVDVQTDDEPGGGREVTAVTVWLADSGRVPDQSAGRTDVSDEIEPVAPVEIDIDGETDAPSAAPGEGAAGESEAVPAGAAPADETVSSRVATLVSSQFGVAADRVRVVREADGAEAGKY